MFHRMEKMIGMAVGASDGEVGKVTDIYFDDHRWAARYFVIDTGSWLDERKVLISPIAVESVDWNKRVVRVGLSRRQVERSPPVDTDRPVSRQHEMDFSTYYGYPHYWSGSSLWGATPYPILPMGAISPVDNGVLESAEIPADPHLRSAAEVIGYRLQATDAAIGHLADFLIDRETWAIRYIVVDLRNWLPGRHVLLPPQWIKQLDWEEQIVDVDVTRDTVQHAPEYDPAIEFSREYEAELYRHYQRPGYWQ